MAEARVLIGRAAELAAVEAALAAARAGRGQLLAFIGEPGIGKTRLADEASARALGHGFRVAWGRTWDGMGAPPGWPWTQILRELVDEGVPLAPSETVDLAPLLPEARTGDPPTSEVGFRAFDALLRVLRRAARSTPRLLVLDDLHAADRLTVLALQVVARSLRDLPLVIIVTQREAEARLRADVGSLLASIVKEGQLFPLARLSEAEVGTLLAGSASAINVHRLTEGNPLFVHEMARLLARGLPAPSPSALPDGIRSALAGHVALLSPNTRQILAAGALLGRELSRADLMAITSTDEDQIEAVLLEATEAGVVTLVRGGASFNHVLLAEALVASLPPSERKRLHSAIAKRLRAAGDARLSELAHHLLEADGDAAEAIGIAKRAATEALRRLAYDRAAELYARALDRVANLHDGERVGIELVLGRGEALGRTGIADEARALCNEAARRARAIGAADLEARAALANATQFNFHMPAPDVVSMLERALVSVGSEHPALRARLLATLSYVSFPSPVESQSLQRAEEAIAIARGLGDRDVLLAVLNDVSPGAYGLTMRSRERVLMGREMAALARAVGDMPALLRGEPHELVGLFDRGEPVDVDQRMRALDALIGPVGPSQERSVLCLFRATHARMQGRFDEAATCVDEAVAVGVADDEPRHRALHAWGQAYTRGSHAELEAARALGEIQLPPGGAIWVAAALGEHSEARRRLRAWQPVGDFASPPMIAALADACVLAADPIAAGVFFPLLAPAAGENLTFGPAFSLGPVDRILAGLALLRGDQAAARAYFESALVLCDRMGALPFRARTLAEYGRALAADEPELARTMLARASTLATTLGMEWLYASLAGPTPDLAQRSGRLVMRRVGEDHVLSLGASEVRLKDSKGLAYLAALVEHPHREIHVLNLVGGGSAERGDAGPVIDQAARRQYEQRLETLEDELREAEAWGDATRVGRAQREIDALADELARAVGLGGRERRAGSLIERARINVQRRLRDVIGRVEKTAPALARYLEATIRTGTFCSYAPLDQ